METYRVTYFNKRGGGEIIRLVLVAAGQTFVDERLDMEQWQNRKHEMPMQRLPVLTLSNGGSEVTYCQSGAIVRWLSRKYGLYGNHDNDLVVDEIYDSVGDVRKVFVQIHFCKDNQRKAELQTTLVNEILPNFYSLFEKRMCDFGERGYIVGSKLTLADLAVFNMVDCVIEMGLESLWQPYQKLLKHRLHILTNINIAKWVNTRPETEV